MINKEATELLEGVIKYYTKRNGQSNAPMYVKQQINRAIALFKEQPPASEFTKEMRFTYELRPKVIEGKIVAKHIFDLCDRLDASEASQKELQAVVDDMLKGLRYLRQTNDIPYGFGIDRLEQTGIAAIAKTNK